MKLSKIRNFEIEAQETECSTLREEMSALAIAYSNLESEFQNEGKGEVVQLTKSLVEKDAMCTKLKERIITLESEMVTKQQSLDKANQLPKYIQLEEKILSLETELVSKQKELDEEKQGSKYIELEEKILSLETELVSKQKELDEGEKDSKYPQLEEKIISLETELVSKQKQLDEGYQDSKYIQLEEKIISLQAEMALKQKALDETTLNLEAYNEKHNTSDNSEDLVNDNLVLRSKVDELE